MGINEGNMDGERATIMEKRSSFRSRKRDKSRAPWNLLPFIAVLLIVLLVFALDINQNDNSSNNSIEPENKKPVSSFPLEKASNITKSSSIQDPATSIVNPSKNIVHSSSTQPEADDEIAGKIGVPLLKNGFEVTVNSVNPQDFHTSIWISVRNMEDTQRPFRLKPSPFIIDNIGNQYENIKVVRSGQIVQNDLYKMARREGAIFFERLKTDTWPEILVLYINGDKTEYMLNASK